MSATTQSNSTDSVNIPDDKTLHNCAKLAVKYDKPILLDYYHDSTIEKAF